MSLLEEAFPEIDVEFIGNNQYKINNHTGKDIRALLFEWAVKNEVSILSQREIENKLEDVFKQLTDNK